MPKNPSFTGRVCHGHSFVSFVDKFKDKFKGKNCTQTDEFAGIVCMRLSAFPKRYCEKHNGVQVP